MQSFKCLEAGLSIDVKLQELMQLTSELLGDLICAENEQPCQSIFNSTYTPSMSVFDFMRRLHKYTKYSKECLVMAIIYIDKYNLKHPEFILNSANVHKIFLTALLLATKMQDDEYFDNKAFEFAGGVNVTQLLCLELHFLETLDFELYIHEQQYFLLQDKLYEVYVEEGEHTADQ